jgi:hypothetical protein
LHHKYLWWSLPSTSSTKLKPSVAVPSTGLIRQATQEARQGQADVARVLGFAEGLPLRVFDGIEHLGQVARPPQVAEALDAEQLGRARGDEGRVAGRGHMRHLFEEVHVLGLARDFVVADQGAVGGAAEGAEFFLVDLLEQGTLVEFQRRLEVLDQFALAGVEHADLQVAAGGAVLDQVVQAGPAAFELLELGRVHDGGQLARNDAVQLRQARIDGGRQVGRDDHRPLHHLADQFRDDVARAFMLAARLGHPALLDDLVEQAGIEFDRPAACSCAAALAASRIALIIPPFAGLGVLRRLSSFSVLFSTSLRMSSSLSLPASLLRRSASLPRASSKPFSGCDLLHHGFGAEVGHRAELQLHVEFAALLADVVRYAEAGDRRDAVQHFVEVVGCRR